MLRATLDGLIQRYGPVVDENVYRPDLFPKSYVFQHGPFRLTITLIKGLSVVIDVYCGAEPRLPAEVILETYSGESGWIRLNVDDSRIARQFPADDPKSKVNRFFASGDAVAIEKTIRDYVTICVLDNSYPTMLAEYRDLKKN